MAVGSRLTLTVGGRSMPFTVAAGHLTDTGGSSTVMVSAAALRRMAPNAGTVAVCAMLPASSDAGAVSSDLQQATASQRDVQLTGTAQRRAATDDDLSTVLILATGMLAVAVLIAVVGIGNTLGLSVLERTGESALLRALGLQRRQLRGMIAVEALLLAAVGAVVGIALGIGYGIAGAKAAVGEADRAASIAIPWGQLGVVLALALIAGLLASVVPARRAARVQPATALAEQL
jgi:putative ABC transport system permease protein